MARALTIQFRPTRNYSKPSVANLVHASGLARATYWLKDGDNLTQNIEIKNTRNAVNLWRNWEKEARNLVIKNLNKNPRKDQILVEEGLMVIGSDLPKTDKEKYLKIFEEFKQWFERTYDTKIFYYVLHDHEGHETEDGVLENLHIHFFFRNVNSKGYGVRKSLKKGDLSNFQTKIYEIGKKHINNLERATDYFSQGKKAPKHKSHKQYREEQKKKQIHALLNTQKQLKEELEKLRKELISKNKKLEELGKEKIFSKTDYDAINALKRQLNAENVPEILDKFFKLKKEYDKRYIFYTIQGKELTREEVLDILKNKNKKLSEALQAQKELKKNNEELKEELEFYRKKVPIFEVFIEYEFSSGFTKVSGYSNFLEKLKKKGIAKDIKVEHDNLKIKKVKIETETGTIIDTGNIISIKSLNIEEDVKLVLDLAEKKGWNLEYVEIKGNEKFKKLVEEEIQKRLKNKKFDFKSLEQERQAKKLYTQKFKRRK